MNVGYIPDSFGHIAMMPAVLQGFAIDTAMVYRGFGGEPGQTSSEYTWRAPDGSSVLMIHLFRHGYSGGYFHHDTEEQILRRFDELKKEIDARATTTHRLLMNGGDHHWPDPKLPETLDLLRRNYDGQFVHSTVPKYVAEVKREVRALPEVSGELRFGYRYAFVVLGGVYSSRMYLKQQNWHCQNLLQRYVEPLNAWATAHGMRSRLPLIRQAWKVLMQNHPHDSICGCSIDPVHREMLTRFVASENISNFIIDNALQHLVPYDDLASKDDRYLFFFNPSAFPRSEISRAEVNFFRQDVIVGLNPDVKIGPKPPPVRGFVLEDADGNQARYQILSRNEGYDISYSRYNYPKQTWSDKLTLLVETKTVPSVGLKGYTIRRSDRHPRFGTALRVGRRFLENEFIRVEASARGEITINDKLNKQVYRGINVFESTGDVGDEYNYSYPRRDRQILSTSRTARIKVVEKGPLRAALQVNISMRVPISATPDRRSRSKRTVILPVTTICYLHEDSRTVLFETSVENNAKDHRFRALFPAGIRVDKVLVDSQFTILEREQKKFDVRKFPIEHPAMVAPMQRFVTVRKGKRGLTLFSYGLPEYELLLDGKGTLALTLLRCVGLLSGDDLITRPGGSAGWYNETPDAQCLGTHAFRYALLTHAEEEIRDHRLLNIEAERFHYPLLPVRRKNPDGLALSGSFLQGTSDDLVLSAVKQTEDGAGYAVRVYNTGAVRRETSIFFDRPVREAWVSRLDEGRLQRISLTGSATVPVVVQPGGIATVYVLLQ
jgi:alpha-mannosidase